MVPAFWMCVGKFRGYGKQLRQYLENILEMCQCHGACFLDVGGKFRGVRETIKTTSRENARNVPVTWCLLFGCGWESFVGTGNN